MFRLRRAFAIKLGAACLAVNFVGCQSAFRPLSVFHNRRSACKPVPSECGACIAPESVAFDGFDPASGYPGVSYGEPIELENLPLLADGQPYFGEGEPIVEGAHPPHFMGGAVPAPGVSAYPAPPQTFPAPPPLQYSAPQPGHGLMPIQPRPQTQQQTQFQQQPQQFQAPRQMPAPQQSVQPAPPVSQPQAMLQLPPPTYHVQAPVTHPSPPPRRARSAKEPSPLPEELVDEPEPVAPPVPPEEEEKPAPKEPEVRPSGLTHEVVVAPAVIDLGGEVRFEIRIRNQGDSPIEKVEFTATLSGNLEPKAVSPEGVGEIDGQSVVFEPLQPLAPMELKYYVTAAAKQLDGGIGKITVEVSSSIPMSEPVTKEATVTIANEDNQDASDD